MARSRRKTPACGATAAESEKQDKQKSHRKVRRRVCQMLRADPEADPLPVEIQLTNPYSMAKDGKVRFDPTTYPQLLRK